MLTPEFHDTAANPISNLILTAENRILQDIARRISRMTRLSATSEYQLTRLADIQEFDHDYKKEIAELLEKTEQEIDALFAEAATQSHIYDKRLFDAKGIPFVPYEENQYMQQLVAGISAQTKAEFKNLSGSFGFVSKTGALLPPKTFYTATLDDVVFQVATGLRDYDSVIKESVRHMAQQGLTVVNYASGHFNRAEVAMRRAVLTGVKQIGGQITQQNIATLGAELVETTAHEGSRPDHQPWQGHVFSLYGKTDKYEDFVMATGYGTGEGLLGWNCRHDYFPFIEGVSTPVYSDDDLNALRERSVATKTYEYTDRHGDKQTKQLTYYDQTQIQRKMETQMRKTRRVTNAVKAAGLDDAYAIGKAKYMTQRSEYKAFSRAMGIDTQFERVYVGNLKTL